MLHLTVHHVFQCSTWAVNKGLIYIMHLPSAFALCKLDHPRATLKHTITVKCVITITYVPQLLILHVYYVLWSTASFMLT